MKKVGNNKPCTCNSGKKFKKCCAAIKVQNNICPVCEECNVVNNQCNLCNDVTLYTSLNKQHQWNTRNIAKSGNGGFEYFTRKYSIKELGHFVKVTVPKVSKKMSEEKTKKLQVDNTRNLDVCNTLIEMLNKGECGTDPTNSQFNEVVNHLEKEIDYCKDSLKQLGDMKPSLDSYYNNDNPQQVFNICSQCKKIVPSTKIIEHCIDDHNFQSYCKACYKKTFSNIPSNDIFL